MHFFLNIFVVCCILSYYKELNFHKNPQALIGDLLKVGDRYPVRTSLQKYNFYSKNKPYCIKNIHFYAYDGIYITQTRFFISHRSQAIPLAGQANRERVPLAR